MKQAKEMTDFTSHAVLMIDINEVLLENALPSVEKWGVGEFMAGVSIPGWGGGIVEAMTDEDQNCFIYVWATHERFAGMSLDAIADMIRYEFNHFILEEIVIEQRETEGDLGKQANQSQE